MPSCRFAFAVHILAMLAYRGGTEVTSALLAGSINTNAVVVRRLLSQLRRAGLLVTSKGVGGGARLARAPRTITLAQIYRAVSGGPGFSHHPHQPNQRCPVGRKIEEVLGGVFSSAQAALENALSQRTLEDVLETVQEHGSAAALPA